MPLREEKVPLRMWRSGAVIVLKRGVIRFRSGHVTQRMRRLPPRAAIVLRRPSLLKQAPMRVWRRIV